MWRSVIKLLREKDINNSPTICTTCVTYFKIFFFFYERRNSFFYIQNTSNVNIETIAANKPINLYKN